MRTLQICLVTAALALVACNSPTGTAKRAVQEHLLDPESAMWRDIEVHKLTAGPLVCGEVNSKNTFGGFVGFRTFMVEGPRVYLAGDSVESANLSICCTRKVGHARYGGSEFDTEGNFTAERVEAACGSFSHELR